MRILDVCCGSRMFWYDKHEPHTTYCDIRQYKKDLPSGHHIDVDPDVVADFRSLPFADCAFDNVIFDPPHLLHAGPKSWLRAKYGVLNTKTWKNDLKQGFDECQRVLKPTGTLVFKWNDDQVPFSKITEVFGQQPIYGDRRGKTRWVVFIKKGSN